MQKFIQEYKSYLEPVSIKLIENCFIISIITCLFSILLLSLHNSFYISHHLLNICIILYRTGLMIGLFPTAFAIIIGKWKHDKK